MIRGLLDEKRSELDAFLAETAPGKGRPRADVSIDMKRAAAVLGADDLCRDKRGNGFLTQKDAIALATQIDAILVAEGERDRPLFGRTVSFGRLQTSVSKGMQELGQPTRFSKK